MTSSAVCKVVNETDIRMDEDMLCRCVAETLKHNAVAQKRLNIVIAGEGEIKALNKRYFGKDVPTDVLSFSDNEDGEYLGEVVICSSFIKKEHKGEKFERELCHVAVHGTFHLLGIHHEKDEKSRQELHTQEEGIINKVLGSQI
ncbi:MAG: rRNA maturation RNase YbeY [Candidatus Spechtbacterales bacterium]